MRRVGLSSIPGGRRTLAVAGILCVVLLAVASTPQLLGSDVRRAFGGLEHARPVWLWAASVGFLGALLCNAWVWRCAIHLCGGRIDRIRAVSCYGVGSLVDTALPARGGDGARVVAWVAAATIARIGGAAAIAAALGVSDPVLAALIIVPTLDLATTIPLTPGNIGIGTGTVAVALQSRGVDLTKALTTGIALQAIETAVSIVVGAGGALYLARFGSATVRRRALAVAAAVVLLVGAFSATVLADLV